MFGNNGNDPGSRKPLHMQNAAIAKAANPSYESFRENETYSGEDTNLDKDRPRAPGLFRRYPNGELDLMAAANQVIDALHKASYLGNLTALEEAMIAVVFPEAIDNPMAAKQGEIYLKISKTEKSEIKKLVQKQLSDEASWNAGRGAGNSYPNRSA